MPTLPAKKTPNEPLFRSGAVAKMAQMPVATLRIWEQRYQAIKPQTSSTGQRMYTKDDVERAQLLRQLTLHGQAIGVIAELTFAQLQDVANNLLQGPAKLGTASRRLNQKAHWVMVGTSLADRVQQPLTPKLQTNSASLVSATLVDVYPDLAQAQQKLAAKGCDLLIWQTGSLDTNDLPALLVAQTVTGAKKLGVVYRFSNTISRGAFIDASVALLQEPNSDHVLNEWLNSLQPNGEKDPTGLKAGGSPLDILALAAGIDSPPKYSEAMLSAVIKHAPSLACECPQHVAQLLIQIASFEEYSASCVNKSPADAALHGYLKRVASASRTLFESALEKVALHEGLTLKA